MKEKMAELIEAFAAARASGNRMLIEFALKQLNMFLQSVDITQKEN